MMLFNKKIRNASTTTISSDQGFIALISTIVISILLLTITLNLGLTGFFSRFNILDSESKERSNALAEACIDSAILDIINGSYPTNKTVDVGPTSNDNCTIISTEIDNPFPGQIKIKTQSFINKSYTNLGVVIDNNTYNIVSWNECPNACP